MKKLVSCLLVVALTCPALRAAPGPDEKHIDSIHKRIAESITHHRIVVIDTYDHRRLQGSVSEAQADGFVLANQGRSTTLMYVQVERVTWSTRFPREVTATIVAAAVAGLLYELVRLLGGLRG